MEMVATSCSGVVIGGFKGARGALAPFPGPISFVQFSGKFWPNNRLASSVWEILDLPLVATENSIYTDLLQKVMKAVVICTFY